jgi:hypothetical protein
MILELFVLTVILAVCFWGFIYSFFERMEMGLGDVRPRWIFMLIASLFGMFFSMMFIGYIIAGGP